MTIMIAYLRVDAERQGVALRGYYIFQDREKQERKGNCRLRSENKISRIGRFLRTHMIHN